MKNEQTTIEKKISPLVARANTLVIRCQADLENAKDAISTVIKALKRRTTYAYPLKRRRASTTTTAYEL